MNDSSMALTPDAKPGLVTIIIPALNEEESIPSTLQELVPECERNDWRIIVVDDGSSDSTAQIVASEWSEQVELLRHKVRRGYGAAIKTGIARTTTDYAVTFDADGQHNPADLTRLLEAALAGDADLVIGDRGPNARGWYRRLGKWIIRSIAHLLLPIHVRDLNSGIKLFRAELGRHYSAFLPDALAFSDVLTLAFISDRRVVIEIPVSIRDRSGGKSTITTMTALDTVIEIVNIITLFNPMRIFIPLSAAGVFAGIAWGTPIVLTGNGVSVGAMLAIVTGVIMFALGLLAEQLSAIRKGRSPDETVVD